MDTLLSLKFDLPHNKIVEDSPALLQHLATIQIAVSICYRAELTKSMTNDDKCKTKVILQNGISSLPIPPSIKNDVELMVALVVDQLSKIRSDASPHSEIFLFIDSNLLQKKVQWTSQGTIDKKRTAQALADSIELDTKTRFEIAAEFYLEEQINALSVHLPRNYLEKHKRKFYSIYKIKSISIARKHFNILQPVPDSKDLFPFCVDEINCHYLWHNLTDAERVDVYTNSFSISSYFPDVALFLFSEANKDQKLKLLQNKNTCGIVIKKLMDLECLPVFNACIHEVSKFLTVNTLVSMLRLCRFKIEEKPVLLAYKTKYAQIFCTLSDILSKVNLNDKKWNSVEKSITCILTVFLEEKEMKVAKMIIESLQNEWIKRWFFQLIHTDLAKLLINDCLKHELLDFIISSIYPSRAERKHFEKFINGDLCLDICFKALQFNNLCDYERLDKFFLSCFQYDRNKLIDLKKKLVNDRNKNANFSFPLKLLYNKLKNKKYVILSNEIIFREQAVVDDYFNWICSNDKEAKEKICEEFWQSKDMICLQQKDDLDKLEFLKELLKEKFNLCNIDDNDLNDSSDSSDANSYFNDTESASDDDYYYIDSD